MEIAMPEDQASKKRRQQHFWSWVTGTKKLPKNEVSKDFKKLNNLRSQHAKLFPQYYEASKSFSILYLALILLELIRFAAYQMKTVGKG